MLAELAPPEKKLPPARDLDGLEDDIAFLSYEQALRSRTRIQPAQSFPAQSFKAPAQNSAPASRESHPPATRIETAPAPGAFVDKSPAGVQPQRKCSSVTIRLSAAESERLHQRAAEAGLTVSAYLRSCAFEVETLRAEVKSTLAQLRSQKPDAETTETTLANQQTLKDQPLRPRLWSRLWARLVHRKARR
jgi:hypothetical protein